MMRLTKYRSEFGQPDTRDETEPPSGSSVTKKPDGTLYCAGEPILDVYIASTWLARLKGLFAYPHIQRHEGLWIYPCASVHTIGMRNTIDVVFLDDCGIVLKSCTLEPGAFAGKKGAHSVVEMAGNMAQQLKIQEGQQLEICEPKT